MGLGCLELCLYDIRELASATPRTWSRAAWSQVANLVLVVFTMFPVRGGSLTMLLLRLGLVLYSLLTILWALLISCRLDTLGWGILLAAVNIVFTVHGVFRVYSAYCSRVRPDLRSAYETLFKPLGVSLVQFKVSFSLSRYQSNYTNNKLVEVS